MNLSPKIEKIGTPKLVLGTANFGNKYGISNSTRAEPLVDFKKAKEII